MGVYLYGIRKMKKVTFTREDGVVLEVSHKLEFKCKPWFHMGKPCKVEAGFIDRLYKSYGPTFNGLVMYDGTIIQWAGSPTWYDSGDFKGTVVAEVRDGKCFMAPVKLQLTGRYGGWPTTLAANFTNGRVEAVELAGRVVFRGSPTGLHSIEAGDTARTMAHWEGYLANAKAAFSKVA